MSDFVNKKLKEWGLDKYIEDFEENEIDEEALKVLTEDLIRSIFKKAGPIAKFLNRWKAEFSINNGEKSTNSTISSPEELVTKVLAEIETEHSKGLALLGSYKVNHDLTELERITLCEILIDEEIRSSPKLVVSPSRLYELAQDMVEIFPSEEISTYYVPYKANKITKTRTLAKGKLHNKHSDIRGIFIKAQVSQKYKNSKRKSSTISTDTRLVILALREDLFKKAELIEEENEQLRAKLEWLKSNIDGIKFLLTGKIRIVQLIKEPLTYDYTNDFPALQNFRRGFELIEIDFASSYPNKIKFFEHEYESFTQEVLAYANNKSKKSAEIKNLLDVVDKTSDLTLKTILIFKLLPLLLPCCSQIPSASKITKKQFSNQNTQTGCWKPSKIESQEGFLLHAKDKIHLETLLAERSEKLKHYGLSNQPVMGFIEESGLITESYVYINSFNYEVSSPLQMIDIAFKSFYALQIAYPKEAIGSWMVIQNRIYKIKSETDVEIPTIFTFIKDLKKFKNRMQ
ncbi:hypothetical protein TKK_0010833 [Trichogramma kaykai]